MTVSTATLTREATKNDESGKAVVEHLQQQVANAFILYANYKHYHWETYGPLFGELDLLFDQFATSVLSTADEFAERSQSSRGEAPVFDYRQMLSLSRIHPSIRGDTMRKMLEEAHANLMLVISEIRESVDRPTMTTTRALWISFPKWCRFMRSTLFLRQLLKHNDRLTR